VGCEENGEAGRVGYQVSCFRAEGDAVHSERFGVGSGAARLGVLSDSQEVVESNVDEVSLGLSVRAETVDCSVVLVQPLQVLCYCDWHGELGGGARIVPAVLVELLLQLLPVDLCAVLVDGVGASVHLEGLADGAYRILN